MSNTIFRSIFSRESSASQGTACPKTGENISDEEKIITKWDPEGSAFAKKTSIFYQSREEAQTFLRAVSNLHRSMKSFMSDSGVSHDELLVRGQHLMKAAIRRLETEFYVILSANCDPLDPDSITADSSSFHSDLEQDKIHAAMDTVDEAESAYFLVMADLRSIADCMISCGHGKECVKIYTKLRRSIVDEGLYKLGFDTLSPSQVQKLDWDVLETRVRNWVAASTVAVHTLFAGERALCDHVFASSYSIRESSFAEIARDPAIHFLGFPELVASKTKKSPEKVFRMLDMYGSLAELLHVIESVFSHDFVSAVRTQAISSLQRVAEAVRALLCDFETAILKDEYKVPVPGGGLHPLPRYTLNYLIFLADYSDSLRDIYADQPFEMPASLPEPVFEAVSAATSAASSPAYHAAEHDLSSISIRFAWLILVLLCKLDSKAKFYHEVPLAYLFLANNLRYVLNKVRGSQLKDILGEEWVVKHESKARRYAASYERMAWGKVFEATAPAVTDAREAREAVIVFENVFRNACRDQAAWIVPDGKMRDELKISLARKLIPGYKSLYQAAAKQLRGENESLIVLRFTPDALENYISDLFIGDASRTALFPLLISTPISGNNQRHRSSEST